MFGLQLDPDEKQLLPYCGLPVCLLMKDGSRKVGQLTACRAGRLVLNGIGAETEIAGVSRKTDTRRKKHPRARKPKQAPPRNLPPPMPTDDFTFAPWGFEPPFASMPRENVQLDTIDSILVL
jgi:hypothetical protein